jgi:hypothetical protein
MDQIVNPKPAIIEEVENYKPSNYEEYVVLGLALRESKDQVQWELGRLAYELTKGYTERKDIYGKKLIENFANDIGIHKKTLERYRRVYKTFNIDNQKGEETNLSFTHYERASSAVDPVDAIERAVEENWTIGQMDLYLSGKQAPAHKEITCPYCGETFQD